ncbi:MAG: electron transport complex subunit RsxG [Gammaproteobacteria bacterium]
MRNVIGATILLALFALIGTALVAFTFDSTKARIAQNERDAILHSIHSIIPTSKYDNDIFTDTIDAPPSPLLGSSKPTTIYRARKDGRPVAVAFPTTAPDGYNGAIKLLVGIYYDGTLAGVRVISENETPGLGDQIELDRTHWILAFTGRSLHNPDSKGWAVKKDGGVFDQFTGATITPRAVVKAVHKALIYFHEHRDKLFPKAAKKAKEREQETHEPAAKPADAH